MPRGSKDGSIIIGPALKVGRRIVEPERIYIRKRYKDPLTGRWREKKRLVENRTEAAEKRPELIAEAKKEQLARINLENHSFEELAKYYEDEYLQEPKSGDTDGLRSWYKLKTPLKALRLEFKNEALRSIDYARIEKFRKRLAKKPVIVDRTSKAAIESGRFKTRCGQRQPRARAAAPHVAYRASEEVDYKPSF